MPETFRANQVCVAPVFRKMLKSLQKMDEPILAKSAYKHWNSPGIRPCWYFQGKLHELNKLF